MKEKAIKELIKEMAFDERTAKDVLFIPEYLEGKHDPVFSSRTYLIVGHPGVGKTHFASRLLQQLDCEILYLANRKFPFTRGIKCNSLAEIDFRLDNTPQVIFIDDANHILSEDIYGRVAEAEKKSFMATLDEAKRDTSKILIVTLNSLSFVDESMLDRFEIKIEVEPPGTGQKEAFLKETYGKALTKGQRRFIAEESVGYNFRDLPEVIRLAYRNRRELTDATLEDAMKRFTPSQLHCFSVERGIKESFKDLYGKGSIKKTLERVKRLQTDPALQSRLDISRHNQLLFYGPPGSGKSFTVRALAGELGFPIISIRGSDITRNPVSIVSRTVDLAKRYKNCVVFIDEAEKLFGNTDPMNDSFMMAEFSQALEGSGGKKVAAIFILAVNDLGRLGEGFQDRFVKIPFDYPDYPERLSFCLEKSRAFPDMKVDYQYLAEQAKGKTYREIERVWNEIVFTTLEGKEVQKSDISYILRNGGTIDPMFG